VSFDDISGLPLQPDMLSFPGLCTMTETYVTKPGVAHSLCAKLSAAQEAEERGNPQAQVGALNAYRHEVEAQANKSLTEHQATVLITLAKTLYPPGHNGDE